MHGSRIDGVLGVRVDAGSLRHKAEPDRAGNDLVDFGEARLKLSALELIRVRFVAFKDDLVEASSELSLILDLRVGVKEIFSTFCHQFFRVLSEL